MVGVLPQISRRPDFILRHATPDDVPALNALGREIFKHTFGHLYPAQDLRDYLRGAYDDAWMQAELRKKDAFVMLAEAEGAPIGFVKAGRCGLPVFHEEGAFEVHRLYIHPIRQGQGVGSALLREAMAWCRGKEAQAVYIGVWENNVGAQRLYSRFGVVPVGEYPFPVGSQIDREIIMKTKKNGL
jgi:ribosomal protein S18 acetylase RimI-like enzyme